MVTLLHDLESNETALGAACGAPPTRAGPTTVGARELAVAAAAPQEETLESFLEGAGLLEYLATLSAAGMGELLRPEIPSVLR